MDEEAAALAVLAKRSFDRTPSEVQQLAACLMRTCHPFFSNMPEDVVRHLCAHVGHAWVEEAHPVYTQGSVGDCMYIITKGYCSVLKHAEPSTSTSGASYTAAAGPTSSSWRNPGSPSSRRSTGTQPASRRATVELQTQQFALATGAVGSSTGLPQTVSRRGTAEVVSTGSVLQPAGSAMSAQMASVLTRPGSMQLPSTGASRQASVSAAHGLAGQGISTAASRQASVMLAGQAATAGSRRVTAEQVVQQRLAESAQLGWLSRGDSFGEAALVNPSQQRPVSMVAGDEGVMLLVLDRACFNRLQQQAQEGQALATAAVQAVLAAACRPILRVGGRGRSLEDVDTLAELFSGLEAFKCMPQPVRTRLAKACQGLQLPSGAVVFEEDDKGDAMYVVVSGSLQVRARPLNPASTAQQQQEALPAQTDVGVGAAVTGAAAGNTACGGAAGKMRATADAVLPHGDGASRCGSTAAKLSQMGSSRRTTWEGVAFTAKEHPKLDAVRTALKAEKLEDEGLGPVVTDKGAKQSSHMVERDGLYWTAKFMADATAAATASEPEWGLEGGMTPLAAVFASKWRQQVRQQAVVHQAQTAAAEEEAADIKAYAAMEEMLGKAAAKAWKAARDNAASLASAAAAGNSSSSQAGGGSTSSSQRSLTTALGNSSSTDRPQDPAGRLSDDALVAAATVVAGESARASRHSEASDNGSSSAAAAADAAGADSSPDAAEVVVPCTPRTAAAAAAQLLAAAAAATDPAEAVKLHLAALGVKDPADVSRTLMAEIGARANLEGLLQAVAEFLEKKGLPRRLNKKSSLKITRELNKRMLAGASWKGYSGSSSQGNSFNQHTAADLSAAPLLKGTGRRVRHAAAAAGDAGSDAEGDLATEATGLSSCHSGWQSSLDAGSEGTSMYGGGMGAEDSMDGSLMDGIDLAASTDTCPGAVAAPRPCAGACSCSCHQRQAGTAGAAGEAASSAATGPCQAGAACCACCGRASQQRESQAAMLHAGGAAAGRGTQLSAAVVSPNCLTERFGPVIRTLGTGDSFGELALLQSTAVHTATVVVAPDAAVEAPVAAGGPAESGEVVVQQAGGSGGALLIKISRSCYDATVRALQVAALEELLCFLSSLPAFSGLSRELLTSLAVFIRPISAQPGQVLAMAGQPADALVIIQTGEVKLLAQSGRSTFSADTSPSLSRNISSNGSSNGSSSGSGGNGAPLTGGAVQQPRSRRTTGTQPAGPLQGRLSLGGQHSNAGAPGAGSYNSSGSDGSSGGQQLGLGVQLTAQQQLAGVQLAVLGAGSLLGENALGYDPEEVDPLAAIAAASSRKARQAATAAAAALTHHATAVATAPCKLLLLAADDLRRFGRRVRGPLAEAAAARRDWLQQRIAAVQVSHSSLGQAATSQASPVRRVSGASHPSPPIHGMSSLTVNNNSTGTPTGGLWQGGLSQGSAAAAAYSAQGGSSAIGGGLWPGLTNLLHPAGTTAAAAAKLLHRNSPGAAAAASRSHWQQQQWQDNAYGELKQRPQLPTQQQISVTDVARLKQLVPVMQPPCVSELAAAARPFPAGMLTASSIAAAGRGGAKGLQLLLSQPQHSQLLQEGAQAAAVGSPKWAVGAGGCVLPAAGSAVQDVPASGRRGPMAGHLERGSEG